MGQLLFPIPNLRQVFAVLVDVLLVLVELVADKLPYAPRL
jgi:hypothetical protein